MTAIEITAPKDELNKLAIQLKEATETEQLSVEINLQENRFDALESEAIALLSITFPGVIAAVSVINLILAIQEKKQQKKLDCESNSSVSLNIELGNGKTLKMEIPSNLSTVGVEKYTSVAKDFMDSSLKSSKNILPVNFNNGKKIEFSEINLLFDELLNRTKTIRELSSKSIEEGDRTTVEISMLEVSLLKILRQENQERSFYLPSKDVETCKEIFFQLEAFQILYFRENKNDIKMLDFENFCVRFEVKMLNLFNEIIRNPEFKYHSFFCT